MVALDDYIIDVLMRDLVGHDRRPVAFLVFLWLAAAQARAQTAMGRLADAFATLAG